MADRHRPDDLAQLRAEFDAFRAQVARERRRRRLPRRTLPLILAALLVALVPLATLAANPFGDLNPDSPHNANIDAIFNAGITTGCVPGSAYCPNGLVTREEMASFLARTAGIGGNPPVANAKTAQTVATSIVQNTVIIPQGGVQEVTVACPAGARVTGGGYEGSLRSLASRPLTLGDGRQGWTAGQVANPALGGIGIGPSPFTVYAVCVGP